MEKLCLNGKWTLLQSGQDKKMDAIVPGNIHLDLMKAGVIEDPFVADNEYRVAWVHETDWVYSRDFFAEPELLGCSKLCLECDGLDTFAVVKLNGEILGDTENMYIQYRFDVTGKLKSGSNNITIEFESAPNKVKPWLAEDPLVSPGMGVPGSIYTRKAPCQWGWDWGPALPTCGIWKSIRIAGYNGARIDDLRIIQHHSENSVSLEIIAELERLDSECIEAIAKITAPDGTVSEVALTIDGNTAKGEFTVANPELWWPANYGKQPLYQVKCKVLRDGVKLHAFKRKVGLRTMELDRTNDEWGQSLTVVVNGVKIFAKGGDWIPADSFPARITDEHYRHLISSAALANMNMLRVWGGGIYEDERFYDLCDEYGILIWQDFMFACGHYATTQWYLDNIAKDVEYNVKRLRNRACLALWCGNNEMEWGVTMWWQDEKKETRQKEYAIIFHELIPSILAKVDTITPYWPSSPSSGMETPFVNPESQDYGDGHYWDVWHGKKPFTEYRTQFHRFMSEFGFESFPSIKTVRSFAEEKDLNPVSYIMECHQKNSAGNGLILHYMAQTFRFPKDFETMCYTSQLLQAEAMRYGVEHWRRNRGRCMGTLYWQFNDCWPVASWASVDYFGRWKALQYFAKRFYEPLLLSVCEEATTATVHVTNDGLQPLEAILKWSLEKLNGEVVKSGNMPFAAGSQRDNLVAELDFTEELAGDGKRQCVLVCELVVGATTRATTVTGFVPTKHLELTNPELQVKTGKDDTGEYIEISAKSTARFVFVEVPEADVIFSDNYFDLPAGRTTKIRPIACAEGADISKVRVFSLYDSFS